MIFVFLLLVENELTQSFLLYVTLACLQQRRTQRGRSVTALNADHCGHEEASEEFNRP